MVLQFVPLRELLCGVVEFTGQLVLVRQVEDLLGAQRAGRRQVVIVAAPGCRWGDRGEVGGALPVQFDVRAVGPVSEVDQGHAMILIHGSGRSDGRPVGSAGT
ncbi:hypothetical protein, partial [Kitasatospora sp. NPDC085464]|uniref:hypothetical protein n=1 Tax=Kitasatospora sp. NPDC085464 TaxID=3364063 RepID=UPI0037C99FF7